MLWRCEGGYLSRRGNALSALIIQQRRWCGLVVRIFGCGCAFRRLGAPHYHAGLTIVSSLRTASCALRRLSAPHCRAGLTIGRPGGLVVATCVA